MYLKFAIFRQISDPMKRLLLVFASIIAIQSSAQNLALSATASASASSSGSYGPANWNDGVIGGSLFGWVGTQPGSFPSPAYIEYDFGQATDFDSIVIYNPPVSTAPPSGNSVVFSGTADIEVHTGGQWVFVTSFSGQNTHGQSYSITFPDVTGDKMRITNISTSSGQHNPGFDEIEVFYTPPPIPDTVDVEVVDVSYSHQGNSKVWMTVEIKNNGNITLDTAYISYSILTTNASQAIAVGLSPGSSSIYNLEDTLYVTDPSFASENLCVYSTNAQDMNPMNDTVCFSMAFLGVLENQIELNYYPNPASKYLQVSGDEISEIRLFSSDGRELKPYFIHSNRIDVSGIPNGIYTLWASDNNGGISVRRVVIHR
jgi:hypothetical protein